MFNVSCNSHYLSHFAASFIDIWAEWSTAKNFFKYFQFNFLYIAQYDTSVYKKDQFRKTSFKSSNNLSKVSHANIDKLTLMKSNLKQ